MTRDDNRSATVGGERTSIWLDTTPATSYSALDDGVSVDTVVVGGGIVGITAATRLEEAGQSVAVVERDRILAGVTGHTTAKLTSLHGLIYRHLLDHFGESKARQYARANESAIDDIESRVDRQDIDCDFERTPAFTYTRSAGEREKIEAEVDAARRLGLPASYTGSTPLPLDVEAAVRFDDQAHFHPRKYLLSLARDVSGDGSYVFERTKALDVDDGEPCRLRTERGEITADDVVVATHFPFVDDALYFTRLHPKYSYALVARMDDEVPGGMYYRSGEPYFSIRPHPAGDESTAIIGGQNHRTGHGGSTAERYRNLEREARERFDVASIEYRWSTQDYVSVDRVPFVGKLAPQRDHVYVATGFGGWGLTNGTAAGRILSDLVLDRESPWREVYRPTRLKPGASTRSFLDHNAHAMEHFLRDHVKKPPHGDASTLEPGEARVLDVDGNSVGVYRDDEGEIHAVSARCTHLDCRVEWNDGEQSWDCPCHGSRFDYDGRVIDTPAVDDLETYSAADLFSLEDDSGT